jgi:hypothetical protein
VLPPTYADGPIEGLDGRLGSKFASRSRAYVEADRELENDTRRKLFDQARAAFVEKDQDADDSIDSGGFAQFAGPDRTEAIAHYNINILVDAAHDAARVIPNDQATMLMLLAEASAARPLHDSNLAASEMAASADLEKHPQAAPSNVEQSLARESSPPRPSDAPLEMPSQAAHASPLPTSQPTLAHAQEAPQPGHNETSAAQGHDASDRPAPARTTHRIMDMLNDDADAPLSKPRASVPPTQDPPAPSTPSGRDRSILHGTPSRVDAARLENIVNQPEQTEHEHHVDQQLMDALSGPVPPPTEPPSPARPEARPEARTEAQTKARKEARPAEDSLPRPLPWVPLIPIPAQQPSMPPMMEADESLRRKDPRETLRKIRELLDRKAAEHGINPPGKDHWSHYLRSYPEGGRPEPAPAYDPQHPSAGLQNTSDTNGHPSHRRESYDRGQPHWDRDRRPSGSRPSPYQGSPPQPYSGEPSRSGHASTHQSPYASLPPKPPGPPPANPVNFRFAHYDPIPPPQARPTYQPPNSNYPPVSHPSHPPSAPGPYGHTYPSPYQHAYAPPGGSYQPPPPQPNAPQYPPLKIHQYGGQPILPASMAPPPYAGLAQHSQPATAPVFSPPPGPASVPQQPQQPPPLQPNPHSEQPDRRDSNFMGPQSRPRRPYRSYHAPGTQFRTYNGPGGGRGRGGGGGGSGGGGGGGS